MHTNEYRVGPLAGAVTLLLFVCIGAQGPTLLARVSQGAAGISEQAIVRAIDAGDVARMAAFIGQGLDVNKPFTDSRNYYSGYTPLGYAALRGSAAVVRLLIKHHARVNASYTTSENGGTVTSPLVQACEMGNVEAARVLLHHGANVRWHASRGESAILCAARSKHPRQLVSILIACGANVQDRDEDGETPLIRAAFAGSSDCIPVLLTHGASLKDRDRKGYTPLLAACAQLHTNVVKDLLAAGASLLDRTDDGSNAIAVAMGPFNDKWDATVLIKYLWRRGCSINAVDHHDSSILDLAVGNGPNDQFRPLVDFLRSHGAKLRQHAGQDLNGQVDKVRAPSGGRREGRRP